MANAAKVFGAKMLVIPMNDKGELDLNKFSKILSKRTKVVFVNHVSNALGTVNDIEKIINLSHNVGASVLIDGAQAVLILKLTYQNLMSTFMCVLHINFADQLVWVFIWKERMARKATAISGRRRND